MSCCCCCRCCRKPSLSVGETNGVLSTIVIQGSDLSSSTLMVLWIAATLSVSCCLSSRVRRTLSQLLELWITGEMHFGTRGGLGLPPAWRVGVFSMVDLVGSGTATNSLGPEGAVPKPVCCSGAFAFVLLLLEPWSIATSLGSPAEDTIFPLRSSVVE